MDEETMKNEFFEWLENVFEPRLRSEKRLRWNDCSVEAWLAATRRADKRAREECMEICSELRRDNYAGENEDWIAGADDCAKAIRATVKEE